MTYNIGMAKIETPEKFEELPLAMVKNMVTLATSGFGVVVALAWNELIKGFVAGYVDPYLGKDGTMISLFIYALLMTALAVLVTMQLATMQRRLEKISVRVMKNHKGDYVEIDHEGTVTPLTKRHKKK